MVDPSNEASAERQVIVRYLKCAAVAWAHRARNLRYDTSQSEPEARHCDAVARAINELAVNIEDGRHWR